MLPYWTNVNTPCGAINDEEGLKSKVAIPTTNGPTGHVHITPNPIEQVGGWQTITYNVTAAGVRDILQLGTSNLGRVCLNGSPDRRHNALRITTHRQRAERLWPIESLTITSMTCV